MRWHAVCRAAGACLQILIGFQNLAVIFFNAVQSFNGLFHFSLLKLMRQHRMALTGSPSKRSLTVKDAFSGLATVELKKISASTICLDFRPKDPAGPRAPRRLKYRSWLGFLGSGNFVGSPAT